MPERKRHPARGGADRSGQGQSALQYIIERARAMPRVRKPLLFPRYRREIPQ